VAESVAIGAIIFLGGVVQGCTGFGLALSTVPVLLLFLPHTQVPPLLVILGLVNSLVVLYETRAAVKMPLIVPLIIGGVIALPVGAFLLKSLDAGPFKLAVGVVVVLMALAFLFGWRLKLTPKWQSLLPVGMISGVLGGSTSLSGPPVILFFAGTSENKQHFRANLIAYFTVLNIASIAVFWAAGLISQVVLTTTAWTVAPLLIGTFAGLWIARRVSEAHFRRAVLVLILAIGLMLVAGNVPS
jgi:uncharacterized membrane protein YfcA